MNYRLRRYELLLRNMNYLPAANMNYAFQAYESYCASHGMNYCIIHVNPLRRGMTLLAEA